MVCSHPAQPLQNEFHSAQVSYENMYTGIIVLRYIVMELSMHVPVSFNRCTQYTPG
jgi:hypothetical protein